MHVHITIHNKIKSWHGWVDQNPAKKNFAQSPFCKVYIMHNVDIRWCHIKWDCLVYMAFSNFHLKQFIAGQAYLDLCDLSCANLVSIILKSIVEWICFMLELGMCMIIRLWKDTIPIKCILDKKTSQRICNVGNGNLKKKVKAENTTSFYVHPLFVEIHPRSFLIGRFH